MRRSRTQLVDLLEPVVTGLGYELVEGLVRNDRMIELLQKRHEQTALSSNVSTGITRLLSKIDTALQGDKIE